VIDIPEQPNKLYSERERGRLQAEGHRTDDDSICTLLVIHETDGRWAIHGLGAPGVRLTNAVIANLAEAILRMAR
jgi:hypothetical protein